MRVRFLLNISSALLGSIPAFLAILAISSCSAQHGQNDAELTSRWVGADHFAIPLHDWSRVDSAFIAQPASYGGRWGSSKSRLYSATKTVGDKGGFTTSFRVQRLKAAASSDQQAELWLGLKSRTPSPKNVWIQAQMVPLEDREPQTAVLEFREKGEWKAVASATLESFSSTFLFRVSNVTRPRYLIACYMETEWQS